MATGKGPALEEVVRAYMARQGSFAMRSVSVKFEDEDVTDIDVWVYNRQSASVRTRSIVDAKNKRSPKAFERILWTRGMQLALGCDRAIVATTDERPKVTRFAQQQKVGLISKSFLTRFESKTDISERLTLEQFLENIQSHKHQKHDGDWIQLLSSAKSAVVSSHGYPAFNRCMQTFRFFAEKANTRPLNIEQAQRASYCVAALACIALDSALEQVVYEGFAVRNQSILMGVTYGDTGNSKNQNSIESVINLITDSMENGKIIAYQVRESLDKLFKSVRADIIAEYFAKEHNASHLFNVAKELDNYAFATNLGSTSNLSLEAKSILGVFCDFVGITRTLLIHQGQDSLEEKAIDLQASIASLEKSENANGLEPRETPKLL